MKNAKVDSNHREIVIGLRAFGASVQSLARIGQGVPDLLCGFRGKNFIFEVKNPEMPKSKRRLTPDEADWHAKWNGSVHVIQNFSEAMKILTQT